jgi:hypothetical protein
LLTFYLFRTAQRQLTILRNDLREQKARHDADMRDQKEQYESARVDALEIQRETAMARLDLIAPRCSLHMRDQAVYVTANGTHVIPPRGTSFPSYRDDSHNVVINVELKFELHNWSTEAVSYSTGSPWRQVVEGDVIGPGGDRTLNYSFQMNIPGWVETERGSQWIDGADSNPGANRYITLRVVTQSLGGEVVETHTWAASINPFEISGHDVKIVRENFVYGRSAAIRDRDYRALRRTGGDN